MPPITTVSKNIIIINVLALMASMLLTNIDINNILGLHYWTSSSFHIWQLVTFVFMHGSISHLFFNMFAVYMFGSPVEYAFGTKRFLTYYLVTGIGSGIVQEVALYFEIAPFIEAVDNCMSNMSPDALATFIQTYRPPSQEAMLLVHNFYSHAEGMTMTDAMPIAQQFLSDYQSAYIASQVTVGASGAVFGILLAFGMLYPNTRILVFFIIPLKAKYLVIIYGALELFQGLGVQFQMDNVAHWAHLGGMLFGFLLLLKWRRG